MNKICVLIPKNDHKNREYLYDFLKNLGIEYYFLEYGKDVTFNSLCKETKLILTYDQYYYWSSSFLLNIKDAKIPILILIDGILEYRNTFERRHLHADGSFFIPVLGHKMACLGRSQARLIESFGNFGKCEVVGHPRFDKFDSCSRAREDGRFVIAVVTAKMPFFNDIQKLKVQKSLIDLRDFFESRKTIDGRNLQVLWRLTQKLDKKIGVKNSEISDFREFLCGVDALIVTPSTCALEGMLLKIPVAVLDYNNCPDFVQSSWKISSQDHIEDVVSELINPPKPKLLWQDICLHDSLECTTPAMPRLSRLIKSMIDIGENCRDSCSDLKFPDQIISPLDLKEEKSSHDYLYSDNTIFQIDDVMALQLRLERLSREYVRLQKRLSLYEMINSFIRKKILK